MAIKVLKQAERPMTEREIWEYSKQNGYDKFVGTNGKTPWKTLSALIYVDIRDNANSPFIKVDSKPKKFYLKELEDQTVIEKEESKIDQPKNTKYHERDLHPFLTYYVNTYLNAYTKTIFHEKSSKRSYTKWLHPDLIGVNFPIGLWETEVVDFGLSIGNQLLKLYSFEVKKELTFANIREAFFQAVSNSSWANEGYLVSVSILDDEEFLTELKRLTSAFGIGIIRIDIQNVDDSEILFPAKQKTEIDWETVNKLAKENPDFRDFIIRVRNDMSRKKLEKKNTIKFLPRNKYLIP